MKRRVLLKSGWVIKELRTKKGWTQAVLSKVSGLSVSSLSKIENGRAYVSEDEAIIIAEALEVSPCLILFPNGFERKDLEPKLRRIRKEAKRLNPQIGYGDSDIIDGDLDIRKAHVNAGLFMDGELFAKVREGASQSGVDCRTFFNRLVSDALKKSV